MSVPSCSVCLVRKKQQEGKTMTTFDLFDLPSPILLPAYDFDYFAEVTDSITWSPADGWWDVA